MIRARDDPTVSIFLGFHNGGYPSAQKLANGEWRDGTYAEYAKFPLENVFPLAEEVLMRKYQYPVPDLCFIGTALVPFGGFVDIGI